MSKRPIVVILQKDDRLACIVFDNQERKDVYLEEEEPSHALEVMLNFRSTNFISALDKLIYAGGNDNIYTGALRELLFAAWLKGLRSKNDIPEQEKLQLLTINTEDTDSEDALKLHNAIRVLCDLDTSYRDVPNLGPGYFQMWHTYRELLWTMWTSGHTVKAFTALAK